MLWLKINHYPTTIYPSITAFLLIVAVVGWLSKQLLLLKPEISRKEYSTSFLHIADLAFVDYSLLP